jgi:hypothetical protein
MSTEIQQRVLLTWTRVATLFLVERLLKVDAVTIQIGTLNRGQRTALLAVTHAMIQRCLIGGVRGLRATTNGNGLSKLHVTRTGSTLVLVEIATDLVLTVIVLDSEVLETGTVK